MFEFIFKFRYQVYQSWSTMKVHSDTLESAEDKAITTLGHRPNYFHLETCTEI